MVHVFTHMLHTCMMVYMLLYREVLIWSGTAFFRDASVVFELDSSIELCWALWEAIQCRLRWSPVPTRILNSMLQVSKLHKRALDRLCAHHTTAILSCIRITTFACLFFICQVQVGYWECSFGYVPSPVQIGSSGSARYGFGECGSRFGIPGQESSQRFA